MAPRECECPVGKPHYPWCHELPPVLIDGQTTLDDTLELE